MGRKAPAEIMLGLLLLVMFVLTFNVKPLKAETWNYYRYSMIDVKPESPTIYDVATVDFDPDTLNLNSKGKWVTCYIELPEDLELWQISIRSIRLNGTIEVAPLRGSLPCEFGDYDHDDVPDLMVKFNGTEVKDYILENYEKVGRLGEVTLSVTGEVGTYPYFLLITFEGYDTISVRDD